MSALAAGPASRFSQAARQFTALIESRRSDSPAAWLASVHTQLAELYAAAVALPQVEPDTEAANGREISHDQWTKLFKELGALLGRWNLYWDVYDPYDQATHDPVAGSLADDLADIYRDVRDGLSLEETDGASHPNDVLWRWRFDFESHWAAHASGALRALGSALFARHAEELPESFGRPSEADAPAS